ncbi:MAG: class I SAM-dependent methyltransferase [Thermomicrobiales bacterium]
MSSPGPVEPGYDINDSVKIQGRDEVQLNDRSLAALRLRRALSAVGGGQQTLLAPGAGAGRYARAIARYRPGWKIVAGDLSSRAVEEAIRYGGGPWYSVFDAENIPFDSRSFDSVVFFDLLEHVPNPDRLLTECFRVLRPGGLLHFFVPLEAQPRTLYSLLDDNRPIPIHEWKRDHVGHIQRFRDQDVLGLVWYSGLHVEESAYSFHLIGQIHDLLDYWQRDRNRGGGGLLPLPAVNAICRAAFILTWRGAYLEDRLYDGPILASGLHVTARRPE